MNRNKINEEMQGFADHLENLKINFSDTPQYCNGNLTPWSEVKKGEIASEIIMAEKYYMDPRNNEGTYEERRAKLKEIIKSVFTKFISERTKEYESVVCHYRGIDWNQAGNSSWKALTCREDLRFDRNTLVHTTNGDWKGGPNYSDNDRVISWKTGGHRRSETFAEIDARFYEIEKLVINELNTARQVLQERGISTDLP
ncbi:hypothetical protein [Flavobacterium caseinilyticum]|uniref:Uncharacterized protein n=1 Tax=Flavobacterium caseinilyticum TaxID=2541732 RepID=A0A4R5AQB7_9FLAO|nr:hypothetical protein [Flavobacterium caseinilyticum]TDD74863.1 hypothetical protein E0F89_13205 [Flavobacterium caseinilyticum]